MLNWLARYAPAAAHLVGDRGRARGSILDVGCGPHGLACARPAIRFVGLDVEFRAPVAPSMTDVRAAPGPLPFADASFHTVLSLDTLEHIPRPDRPGFVAELARVAACEVLFACPSSDAAGLDEAVRARYAAAGQEAPGWLAEHGLYRLPEPAEIEELVRAVPGFRARPWPMVNGVLSSAVTLADLFELHNDTAREAEELRDEWVELLSGATFGPSLRAGWVLERDEPRTAIVPEGAAASGLPAALRCPRCGGSFEWAGDTLACTGCGSVST